MITMETPPHTPAPAQAKSVRSKSGRTSVRPVALAEAAAHAASTVPGAVDVRSGRTVLAPTYGPHTSVSGVAISHPAPGRLVVEIHIVVSPAAISLAGAVGGRNKARLATLHAPNTPVLLHLAGQVRGAVYSVLRRYGERPSAVDISIDDLQ